MIWFFSLTCQLIKSGRGARILPARSLKGLLVKNGKHFNCLFGFLLYVCVICSRGKKGPMDTQEIISLIISVSMLCGPM
jgi:hypothetical protein